MPYPPTATDDLGLTYRSAREQLVGPQWGTMKCLAHVYEPRARAGRIGRDWRRPPERQACDGRRTGRPRGDELNRDGAKDLVERHLQRGGARDDHALRRLTFGLVNQIRKVEPGCYTKREPERGRG
jgi:hypothetical protein